MCAQRKGGILKLYYGLLKVIKLSRKNWKESKCHKTKSHPPLSFRNVSCTNLLCLDDQGLILQSCLHLRTNKESFPTQTKKYSNKKMLCQNLRYYNLKYL